MAALGLLVLACGNSSSGPDGRPPDNFDRNALLANLADNIVVPAYRDAHTSGVALETAIGAWCTALGTGVEVTRRDEARAAWRDAMAKWQRIEMMRFGPVAMNDGALRDRIYSWPVISGCAVDQDVMLARDDPAYDINARLTNRRGFDALEYLLFNESLATVCPLQSAPPGWDALSDADKRAARCSFAAIAAADLVAQLKAARDAWAPAAGNYAGELASAGQVGSSFTSAHAAVNVVSDAMFYIHNDVQDMKLAEPAGITINACGTVQAPCLTELESPWAFASREHVVENLISFQLLFLGGEPGQDGVGFDDFLRELGANELADLVTADIAAARAAAEGISTTLRDALGTDYAAVVALHAAVKKISDNMKSQLTAVLGLEIPDSAAADND